MFDLSTFHQSKADTSSDNGFALDDRTVEGLLQFLQDYSQLIPFAENSNWDKIFLAPANAQRLAAIYRQPELADGSLAPQQALLLAFYRLLETPKALLNRLPAMHRQLYYRGLLGLKPRAMVPDQVALACQLEKGVHECLLPAGTLMDGGQDSQGNPVQYALDNLLLANQGQWSDLRWCQPGDAGQRVSRVLFDQTNEVAWPESGVRLFNRTDAEDQPVVTGRVVGSELLSMSGGDRTITVTLQTTVTDDDIKAITAGVSSAGQWLALVIDKGGDDKSLSLKLSATQGAITPPDGLDGFTSAMPLLKLSRIDGKPVPEVTALAVAVSGLTQVMYSSDAGVEKLSGTSYPFGHSPVMGNGFNLVAADWCNKPQELTISLTPEWLDLPEQSFSKWYMGYAEDGKSPIGSNADFTVTSDYMIGSTALFSGSTDDKPAANAIQLKVTNLSGLSMASVDPKDWQSYLRLELSGHDFLHQQYWKRLPAKPDLNPPYTPQIKSLAVSYSGTDDKVKEQYLLTAFGYGSEPQVSSTLADDTKPQLYLGFSDIEPGQQLNLHWQLQSPQPQDLKWQYLDQKNTWQSLDAQVIDGTGGLFASGLWSAPLPDDAAQGVQMPAGRYWVRAVLTPPAQASGADACISAYPRLHGLLANAVTATLINGESLDNSHFTQPLPAGTVRQPVQKLSGLAQVTQPWPSQGGRAPESDAQFLPRVARQLVHRGRAQTWSDMATLLKDRYPEIGYVHIPLSEQLSSLPARCTQQLIVIPANGEQDNSDALRPKFAPARLAAMKAYLQGLSSPWVDICVVNPDYRDVPVTYSVTFIPGTNQDFAQRQLRQALEREYMPWGWDGQSSAIVGTALDYYAMVAFIQQFPMVECVHSLALDGQAASLVSADTQVLVLTLPDDNHR
ncbi:MULTISPECIES: hypothetical protein [unclassified Pseudomonas]|uniref:hypothetical protein n=1 Tax=unclassified Pseudomonas TaxID=196821 RepID=UPI000C88C828|nr:MULTISPECIES: hypothetical protein [unclassified Pseudomonas]